MAEDYSDYSIPVHTSLMEQKLLFGIGEKAFFSILIISTLMACIVSVYCIAIGIISLFICRKLCKNESLLLDFLFENLFQSDIYEG